MIRGALALALLAACRGPATPAAERAPRNVVVIGPSPRFTVLLGSFTAVRDLRYHDAHCLAVPTRDGAEPVSADAGRLEAWVVGGDILGHVARNGDGLYHAAVRRVLPPGTRLAARVPGSGDVPAHQFRTPATVPTAARREAPGPGFAMRAGAGLPVRWIPGSGSHVTLTLALDPAGGRGDGLLVTCAAPAAAGAFTIPAAALAAAPAGVTTARLALAATDRAREGDFALDVVLVGDDGAEVTGTFSR